MINDLVSDSITRIRNAYMRKLSTTNLLHSKMVLSVVKILTDKGYISSYTVKEKEGKKRIKVVLKYNESGTPAINEIAKVSKPGRRVYKGKVDIAHYKNGYGTIIVSTSKGVIPNDEAKVQGVGGEVICTVW